MKASVANVFLKEIDDNRRARFRSAATNGREKKLLNEFKTGLEARLESERDQAIGEKTTPRVTELGE